MTTPAAVEFLAPDLDAIAEAEGRVVVFVTSDGKLDQFARRVNRLTRGAVERVAESVGFGKLKEGSGRMLAFPTGMAADALHIVKLDRRPDPLLARKTGVNLGKSSGGDEVLVLAGNTKNARDIALGAVLRDYAFIDHKTGDSDEKAKDPVSVKVMVNRIEDHETSAAWVAARAAGVFFTRDLVNEPSNILTTTEFANRLVALKDLGVKVRVMEEAELEKLGMRTLLAVGQGSESPSKVVVMEWMGGGKEKPVALVGKGVVFDTGGISLKPAGGMEDMTMDMGGAGTVAGTMKTLAMRKAKANVVGIVGLVENMPDGRAQRPGDVVRSMKGDTVEVINTDAEGRLVLCDVMWFAQEEYEPVAMVDLATLTGAVIIALGHENAGVFANDDPLAKAFLGAAESEGEGAWRLPLGPGYDKLIKSNFADMKNVGGRGAGSITAAQFLQRFVKEGQPWMHLDIAGVAATKTESTHAPKGASGWGVMSLDRMIKDSYEG